MKKKYDLNVGTLAANGLYNITPKDKKDKRISLWFDKDTYRQITKLKAEEFNSVCEAMLQDDN